MLLNKQAGRSHGKVAACWRTLFGVALTRGASAQIALRTAARLEPAHQEIRADLPLSAQIAADETGWRIGGHPAWLPAWVGERATSDAIDLSRSVSALEAVLGLDWEGTLIHDGWASYDRFPEAVHQRCLAHVLRRARERLAVSTRGAVRFPRQVIALLTEAIPLKNQYHAGAGPLEAVGAARDGFDDRLLELMTRPRAVPAFRRRAGHLLRYAESWFSFVTEPSLPATNWPAEQALRPAVVNRKVWGGNRTQGGRDRSGRPDVGDRDLSAADPLGHGLPERDLAGVGQPTTPAARSALTPLNKYNWPCSWLVTAVSRRNRR